MLEMMLAGKAGNPKPDYLTFGIADKGYDVGGATTSGNFFFLHNALSQHDVRALDCKTNPAGELLLAIGYYNVSSSYEGFILYTIDKETGFTTGLKPVFPSIVGQITDVSISPDGSLVAISMTGGRYLLVYEIETGNQVTSAPDFTGENASCNQVSFSYDSSYLYVGRFGSASYPFAAYTTSGWSMVYYDSSVGGSIDALSALNTQNKAVAGNRLSNYPAVLYPIGSNRGSYERNFKCKYISVSHDDSYVAALGNDQHNFGLTIIMSSSDGYDKNHATLSIPPAPASFTPDGNFLVYGDRVVSTATFLQTHNLDYSAGSVISPLL